MKIPIQGLRVTLISVLISIGYLAKAQQVWYVNSSVGNDTYDGQSPTDNGGGVGPFQTIQQAVMVANDMDTVRVAAGEYLGYVLIDKSLTLLGANSGISGGGSRGGESVIYPTSTKLGTPASSSNALIQIAAADVTLDGFEINGNNDTVNSNNTVNGVDVDYSYGLIIFGNFDKVLVRNNRIINFDKGGIEALGDVGAPNSNCAISGNFLNNMGDESIGVTCGNGYYTDILSNEIHNTATAMFLYDFTTNSGKPLLVSGNNITVREVGVLMNKLNSNTSNIYLEKNNLKAVTGFTGSQAIFLRNSVGAYNLEVRNCNISGFENGAFLLNSELPVKAFQYDTIESCKTGILSISNTQYSIDDSISIESSVLNECSEYGISMNSDTTRTIVTMDASVVKDCGNGILGAGNVELRPGNTEFETIKGFYLEHDTANSNIFSSVDVDARQCVFEGNTGKGNTPDDNFTVEDKIRHFMDNTNYPFVNFHDSTIYVSSNDMNSVIMRGVGKASDDWHIHVQNLPSAENVDIDKQLHITTHGFVKVESLALNTFLGQQVFLHDTLIVSEDLNLNTGVLNTQDGLCSVGEILVTAGNENITANSVSYVNGPLEIIVQVSGADTVFFPVGTDNTYRPLYINLKNSSVGNWDAITGSLVETGVPAIPVSNGISHVSDIRYWSLMSRNGLVHDNVEYKASYSAISGDDEAGEAANLRLAHELNGQWYNIGGTGTADGTGTIQSTDPVTFISDVALANAKNGRNKLGKGNVIAAFDALSVCDGDTVVFVDNSTALVGNIVGYRWDFGDASATDDTSWLANPRFAFQAPGSYNARLVVITDMAETDTTYRTINVFNNPSVGFIEQIFCYPNSCTFSDTSTVASPDIIASRLWEIDGSTYTLPNVAHNFPATGTYTAKLTVTTRNGCVDSLSKTFDQLDSVKISITPVGPVSICAGDSVTLTANTGLTSYSWNTGGTTNAIQAKTSGKYTVIGYNSNYCFGIDSVRVNIAAQPVANAGADVFIEYGTSTTLQGSGGGTYSWDPPGRLNRSDTATPVATPLTTTTYVLTVTNSTGCTDTDTVIISVGPPKYIEVPNLLSPNGDMFNDVWDLSEIPDIENNKVTVINRWGKVVFESDNYQHDWDGTYEGQPLPDGTYLYIIEGSEFYEALKGPLQIIR